MRFPLNPPVAAARPTARPDSAGTSPRQQSQPRATVDASRWLGWLSLLPRRNRNAPELPQPQGPQHELPQDLLELVVVRTADAGHPQAAARDLAMLRPVNKAFRDAADTAQKKDPAVQRAASEQRLAHAIREATRELGELPEERVHCTTAGARLAAVVHSLDPVVVDLDLFSNFRGVAQAFQDALSRHRGNPTLEIAASEGALLNHMVRLLDTRPELLRSLDVTMPDDYSSMPPHAAQAARSTQRELSKVLPKQKNLRVLKLHVANLEVINYQRPAIQATGLDNAMASLPSLQSLALCGYQYRGEDTGVLTDVLRKLPALEDLDLSHNMLQAAAFAQVASSLPDIPRLQSLNLSCTVLDPGWAEQLGRVLPNLAELRTLNLLGIDFNTTHGIDMEHLAGGLIGLTQLENLNLSCNPLGPEGASRLTRLLPHLANLRTLDLGQTNLDAISIGHLAENLASLKQLQTLNLTGNPLEPMACSQLTASLAGVPTLRDLYFTVPRQPAQVSTTPAGPSNLGGRSPRVAHRNTVDVNTLENILRPLAERGGLHIHLSGLDEVSLPRLQSALPALRIHHEP
jgi:hypothetical protein